jgi:putative SOS response-associated peptidase YedK
MCGRFTNRLTWEEIVRLYRLAIKTPPHNLPPRYNICPTDPVDVVTERDCNRD